MMAKEIVRGRLAIMPDGDNEREAARRLLVGLVEKETIWTADGCLLNRIALAKLFDQGHLLRDTPLPEGATNAGVRAQLDSRLFDYQVSDIRKTIGHEYVLNANPMGYGKTVEALQWCKAKGHRTLLIVAPKSTRYQWQKAVWDWFDSEAEIGLAPRSLSSLVAADVVITNYEPLIVKGAPYAEMRGGWDCIIADECHRIRNTKAKTAVALRALSALGGARIGLTGTPIMNQPDDLWGIGLWLNPSIFGRSYWNFVNQYCKVEENFWGRKVVGASEDPVKRQILKDTLDMFWIRNPQNLFGEGTVIASVPLEMYPQQSKLYRDIRTLALDELDKLDIMIPNAMTQLMKLQQVTTNPQEMLPEIGNIKFEWIRDLLEDNPDLKICVFSKFKQAVKALGKFLTEAGIGVSYIHGDVTAKAREEEKQRFIGDAGVRVMLGTIGAMSEGIDGLQQVCWTTIFLDRAWNPEENNQAIARVARMGQTHRVSVYMLDCIRTIDAHVEKVNALKLEDIKELIWREC